MKNNIKNNNIKKKRELLGLKMVVVALLILSLMFVFAGCGTPKNLEDYIASDKDAAKSFEALKSSGEASGMSVDVKENTLVYTYRYTDTYTGDTLAQMKTTIEKTMEDKESTVENIAGTFEKESGIDDITVEVIYENGDGSQICKVEY